MNSAKGAPVLPRLIQIVEQSSPDSVQDLMTQERYAGIKKGIEQIWWCSPDTPEAAGHGREAPETLHEECQWSHSHSAIHAWEDKWCRICMNQSLRAREWLEKGKVKTIHTHTNKQSQNRESPQDHIEGHRVMDQVVGHHLPHPPLLQDHHSALLSQPEGLLPQAHL